MTPNTGDWHLVTNRPKKFPQGWKTAQTQPPQQARPYMTYAQALRSTPSSAATSPKNSSNSSFGSRPPTPTTPPSTTYYISPHSPTHLRFPPSPSFREWKGRCLRYCRIGHNKAVWQVGHVGSRCNIPTLQTAANPTTRLPKPAAQIHAEPSFDDMLTGPYQVVPLSLPSDRPFKTCVFIHRDDKYFQEMQRFSRAVVLHTNEPQMELSADLIAAYAARTGLVTKEEVSVAILTRGRYLIHLPPGVAPETFIEATPVDIWDLGYEFQKWTPLDDAAIIIPSFRVLVALEGLPALLWREDIAIQAINHFGTYLGSVVP